MIFLLSGALLVLLFLNFSPSWKKQGALISDPQDSVPANLPKKISRGRVNFFELGGSGKVVFYEESDSTVYEADLDGKNKKELARIPGVLKMVFSPLGYELEAKVSEKNTLKNYYFDLKNNKRIELPKNAESLVFSPDGREITYYSYNNQTGEGGISTADPDGSDSKTIFKTRIKNPILIWPQDNLIVFYLKEEGNQPLVFSIRPDGKEFQKLSEEEYNFYSKENSKKISPLKDFILFLNAEDGKLYSLKI